MVYMGNHHTVYLMSYQKNTIPVPQDSPALQLSDSVKVAQKTGRIYFRLDTVTDGDFGSAVEDMLNNGSIHTIPYLGRFYAAVDRDGSILIYEFITEQEADSFLDYKPASGFQPKSTNTYTPKPKSSFSSSSGGGQGSSKTFTPRSSTTVQTVEPQGIITFTDIEAVQVSNKDAIRENERQGKRILPASLIGANTAISLDENGKMVLWMGKIISVQPTSI